MTSGALHAVPKVFTIRELPTRTQELKVLLCLAARLGAARLRVSSEADRVEPVESRNLVVKFERRLPKQTNFDRGGEGTDANLGGDSGPGLCASERIGLKMEPRGILNVYHSERDSLVRG